MKIKIEEMKLQSIDYRLLKPLQGELKELSKKNYDKLKKSFSENGLFLPMFVWKNKEDFFLLDGHGRERVFNQEGAVFLDKNGKNTYEVPALIIQAKSLEDAKKKILLISSQFQKITQEGLDEFTADFDDSWLSDSVSFDAFPYLEEEEEKELKKGLVDEDQIPEIPLKAKTKIGDIYVMGNHKLICGDSKDFKTWEKLQLPKDCILFTSPPYNIGKNTIGSGSALNKKGGGPYLNSNDSNKNYQELIQSFTDNGLKFCSASVFNVQLLAGCKIEILTWLEKNKSHFVDMITWDKGHSAPAMASGVLNSQTEWLIIFSSQENPKRTIPFSSWRGTLSSIYSAPPQRQNEFSDIHAATFPAHLPRFIIGDLMDKSENIVDCCMGTGTTLIACEELEKKCFGIELDPIYCDVIVKRWENFTGKKAELLFKFNV